MSKSNTSLTTKQESAILALIKRVGREEYRRIRAELGILPDIPFTWLTKSQAAQLIGRMVKTAEGAGDDQG